MKRLAIFRGGVAMALMLGILVAVASSAEASRSGQLGVFMRKGLSLKRAQVALATQSQVETAELPTKLEAALGADFAGMWFESSTGKFCIGVVSSASRRTAERLVAQAGLAGVVSYVSVRSTWSQLIGAKGEWSAKLEHLGWRQFSTGLTPSSNAVSVTLSSSVPEHERALLECEAARYHVNVSITVVPPEELQVGHNNSQCEYKRGENYAFCTKPIAAGVLIAPVAKAEKYCTAGPLAILSKPATLAAELETLLITAGHCLEPAENGKWFTAPHPAGEFTEFGPRIKFVNGLAGDFGDIEVTGANGWLQAGVTPALAQITNYQDNGLREARNVVGEAASVLGASFCKQGAKSGEQCGEITAVEQLVLFESGEHTDGLVITNACAEKGDSGGPYHTLPSGNSVRILGTEIGSPAQTCTGLFCPTCKTEYEPIKTSLITLGLTLLTTSNQTRHATARHPLFLTESGTELLFSGSNPAGTTPTLRALNLGVLGTITCERVLVDGFARPKSPLAHSVLVVFHGKCEQTIGVNKSACTEPILWKPSSAELGLVLGNKTVGILLTPEGTPVFATPTCGGNTTTIEGAVVGEVPEINKKAENQYNKLLSEIEYVFEAAGKNSENQNITSIELLGTTMTGAELKVTGFFGGKASQEMTLILKGDGKIEICTKEPQNCP
jgi:hypothetical protein